MKTRYAMIAAAATLVAAPAAAQVMTGPEYIKTAGASDLYERQSSQTVLETTRNPAIQSFAKMMIMHHQKSTDDVKAAATRAKLPVAPPMLTPAQNEMIAQLKAETGPARDAAYVAQQRAAHGQALAVQQAYAMGGTVAPLKTAAGGIVPVVKSHIEMLKKM